MTVTLDLRPETHADLLAQARARGLSVEAYVEQLVREQSESASRRARAGRKSLPQLFAESPLKGLDLAFERDSDTGRPLAL